MSGAFLQRFVAARDAWQLSEHFWCSDPAMRPRVGPQLVNSWAWAIEMLELWKSKQVSEEESVESRGVDRRLDASGLARVLA